MPLDFTAQNRTIVTSGLIHLLKCFLTVCAVYSQMNTTFYLFYPLFNFGSYFEIVLFQVSPECRSLVEGLK